MNQLMRKIVEKVINERNDIPETFAVDADLAKQAEEYAISGNEKEAERIFREAVNKEYGFPK